MNHLYMFKASGLQRFIFATSRLKDVVGASALIESLTSDHLDAALAQLHVGEADHEVIQRAAGQATVLFRNARDAATMARVWPAACAALAPGLETSHWLGEVDEDDLFGALERGWASLRSSRSVLSVRVPEVTPPALRAPASGDAVCEIHRSGGARELVDEATLRKRRISERIEHVASALSPADVDPGWGEASWTLETDRIARGERSYLAIVHADGNRLGNFFMSLARLARASSASIADLYADASALVERCTVDSVQGALAACADQLEPQGGEVPARPVIMGGDDVTMLLPSAVAVRFAAELLRRFAESTKGRLDELARKHGIARSGLPNALTACAGIAFQRPRQPLMEGVEVSELLCGFSKSRSREPGGETISSLMFARLLDYDDTDLAERVHADFVDPTSRVRLSSGPYAVQQGTRLAQLSRLERAAEALRAPALGGGGMRAVVDQLHLDHDAARRQYERTTIVAGAAGALLRDAMYEIYEGVLGEHPPRLEVLSALPDAMMSNVMRGGES